MIGVLAALRMDGVIALGIASGFLNLIPLSGVVLASAVPLLAAALQIRERGPVPNHRAYSNGAASLVCQSADTEIYLRA